MDEVAGPGYDRAMSITLILGGARSGKSSRAQALAEKVAPDRVYIATAQALDTEMEDRIAHHRAARGEGWRTVEAPLALADALKAQTQPGAVVLVDCLTLWLSNLMHHGRDVEAETDGLCRVLEQAGGDIILVSNEVGLGLVPETALGRAFRDAQGRLNQGVAAVCGTVEFVAAGLPLRLKG